jgi:hypothetical protein
MMSVDVIGNVRRAFFEQHLPIKEIVRTEPRRVCRRLFGLS